MWQFASVDVDETSAVNMFDMNSGHVVRLCNSKSCVSAEYRIVY